MTVMEESDIRELIDSRVDWGDECKLSPGHAAMAMVGPIIDHRKRLPLGGVRTFYRGASIDLLFREGVTEESINDKVLAWNLDSLHKAGQEELFWSCSRLIKSRHGFNSRIRHMDCTNYIVQALPPNAGTAVPSPGSSGGNAKDGRNDLLQYYAATVTDGNRVLEYCRVYSGNTSDVVMNADTLEFLKTHLGPKDDTVIADSKLVNENLIASANRMGMDDVGDVYRVYDTEADTVCRRLRFITYKSPNGTGRAMDCLRRQGLKDAVRRFNPIMKRAFACREDASWFLDEVMGSHRDSAYDVVADTVGGILSKGGRLADALRKMPHPLRRTPSGASGSGSSSTR